MFAFGAAAGAAFLAAAELSLFALIRSSKKLILFKNNFKTIVTAQYHYERRVSSCILLQPNAALMIFTQQSQILLR